MDQKKLNFAPVALAVLMAIICLTAGWFLNSHINRNTSEVNSDSVREEILPVAKLVTYEYNFTQIMHFSDANKILGFEVPITKNTYIATVDGVAYIGFDAEMLSCKTTNENGTLTKVVVTMPHSTLYDVAIHHDTLKKYEQRDGLFNRITTDDFNGLLSEVKAAQKEKVEASDLLAKSDERAKQLIADHIKSVYGESVVVEFEHI